MRTMLAQIRKQVPHPALYLFMLFAAFACTQLSARGSSSGFQLGYNTHFSQGWPDKVWFLADDLPADILRDGLHWAEIERSPGHIEFNPKNSGYIRAACRHGLRPVPVIPISHPLYDGGKTIYTDAGRQALARFVKTVADEFDGCIAGIELGNEINSAGVINGPAAANGPADYVEMLKAIWQAVKPRHPDFLIVGGGAHSVATGFLERMFAVGGLDYMDAVVVHPYRSSGAENLDWELENLRSVMRRYGPERPIWATEFGIEIKDQASSDRQSPIFMTKMVAVMAVNGVEQASWYALQDEQWWPNMGLFRLNGQMKPAARTFDFLHRQVLPSGQARRLNETVPALYQFAFGDMFQLIWGAPRQFSVDGAATFLDLQGNPIEKPASISETPFFFKGRATIRLGPATVAADSLSGYGRAPWSYYARPSKGALVPLKVRNWTWTSDFVSPSNGDLNLGAESLLPAGAKGNPTSIVVRLVAPADGAFVISSCASSKEPGSLEMMLRHNDRDLMRVALTTSLTDHPRQVQLNAGDVIEWEFAPVGPRWPAYGRYRLRLLSGGDVMSCGKAGS